jgi:hypothetical protein
MGGDYDVECGEMSPEGEMVYRDLIDVVESEFERLSGLYSGCREVDWMELACVFARYERERVVDGLPCDVYVGTVFAGGGFLDLEERRYRFDLVLGGEGWLKEGTFATFRVAFIGDRCFVKKTINSSWLEWVAKKIVDEAFEGEL